MRPGRGPADPELFAIVRSEIPPRNTADSAIDHAGVTSGRVACGDPTENIVRPHIESPLLYTAAASVRFARSTAIPAIDHAADAPD